MQAYATPETGLPPQLRLVESSSRTSAGPIIDAGRDGLDQLLGQLAELVADRVAARLRAPRRERADAWLDTHRAADYLGISRDRLRRLAAEGSIPTEQEGVGCKLYFRRSDLDKWRCMGSAPTVAMRGRCHG